MIAAPTRGRHGVRVEGRGLRMRWVSVSRQDAPEVAAAAGARALVSEVRAGLQRDPDLVCLAVTPEHAVSLPAILSCFQASFPRASLVGSVTSGVIGPDGEHERGPCAVAWAATLPDVDVTVIRLAPDTVARLGPEAQAAVRRALHDAGDPAGFSGALAWVDGRGTDVAGLVATLGAAMPGVPIVGGVVGDGATVGGLGWGTEVGRGGAVVVVLRGDVVVDTLVGGSVRPVGPPMVVTASEGQVVREIDGEPALVRLEQVLEDLSSEERGRIQRNPLLGFPADTARRPPAPDELLVRPVVGVDPTRRAFVLGAALSDLQPTMRFVLRDPSHAATSLRAAAAQIAAKRGRARPQEAGVIAWACVGRGEAFFGAPDSDLDALRSELGGAVAGSFVQGEIGPVRGAPYLHAFAASVAVIRRRAVEDWD
jgi:small ligand-binding sensory domain FIST